MKYITPNYFTEMTTCYSTLPGKASKTVDEGTVSTEKRIIL